MWRNPRTGSFDNIFGTPGKLLGWPFTFPHAQPFSDHSLTPLSLRSHSLRSHSLRSLSLSFVTPDSMLGLFEMATLEMWPEFMYHAVDIADVNLHLVRDVSVSSLGIYYLLYLY